MRAINPLYVALVAMFLQQSLVTVARIVVPIVATVAFPALGIEATYVGVFAGVLSFGQVVFVLFSGNLIRRYGGLGISQIGLLFVLVGMLAAASGHLWTFALTALFVSFGMSVGTPASSHMLARFSPPRYAPLTFSAKQTAVPFGYIIAGVTVPFLVAKFGWQGSFVAVGLMCGGLAVLLEPARASLDQDRDPHQRLAPRDIKGHLLTAMRHPGLRVQILAQAAFVGLATVYNTYFVLFFHERLGYSLAAAGGMFALSTLIGLPSRMVWGYVASQWLHSNTVLALLGFVMTVAVIMTGFNAPEWPVWALLAVAVAVNATASGWQGVALSEVARLAPPGHVGAITASVISLSCIGQVIMPPLFAAVLALTDNYLLGFILSALPAAAAGLLLIFANRRPKAAV
jgi:MFS family permease